MATKLHLGINLAFARMRWPQPVEWLWVVNKLGIKYVEFCSDFLDPILISKPTRLEVARKTRKEADEDGVIIYDYYTGMIPHCLNLLSDARPSVRKDGLRWCEEAIKVASALGVRAIGGHFDHISYRALIRPRKRIFLIQCLFKAYQHLSELARKEGLEFMMLEQMYVPGEKPYTIEESEEFYRKLNESSAVPIYLTIDVGHSCCLNYLHKEEDLDPYEWLRRFAHISPVIHIHQTNGKESQHHPFTKIYNQVGIITPEKVIKAIEASGSKENYLMLEIFFPLTVNEKQLINDLYETVIYWRKYVVD
ncbi:hypothetical protein AUJ66_08115 [Candidatus Desantisbacteria bacterium CG1_02_38_46]|uniref:Xylose isomerase-like TIM barrel domain-containing protein n=3 Tax=unclassified Candidatus Desantisiibacteriota TaxID=3106372 RepID=A0A2H9PCR1_9BACT|nr:MAG: hypothetical protein AUJ66_08115 [Candidatus Desantisbacteria bacterium CG1_02_38_46]PIU51463.1 MAG: hypothetical protein COS91_04265 [Candidatus Desantisbacteria bacterium CG07_land_8_20_14_0_80_39_15]PIZ17071.1 MAG: hypothetical protein COY51_01270 [Candidatus Desantisbacteria bacterium CG_4_10_14_0_8_um_filter_39_17]